MWPLFVLLLMEAGNCNLLDDIGNASKNVVCGIAGGLCTSTTSDPQIESTTSGSTATSSTETPTTSYTPTEVDQPYPCVINDGSMSSRVLLANGTSLSRRDVYQLGITPCRNSSTTSTEMTTTSTVSTPAASTTPSDVPISSTYQSYPCRLNNSGPNRGRVYYANGTDFDYYEVFPDSNGTFPNCQNSTLSIDTNSSTTSTEMTTTSTVSTPTASTTSSVSLSSTESTVTSSTTSEATGTTSESTTSTAGTNGTLPTKSPNDTRITISSLETEETETPTPPASFGTSETSTTGTISTSTKSTTMEHDSSENGVTASTATAMATGSDRTDYSQEKSSTEEDYSTETESEILSSTGGPTWAGKKEDGEQSTISIKSTSSTGTETTPTKTKEEETEAPVSTVSPASLSIGTASTPSTISLLPRNGTDSTTSTVSTTSTNGHSSPTVSDEASATEKSPEKSFGTSPSSGIPEEVGSSGTESESTESGSTEGSTDSSESSNDPTDSDETSPSSASVASDSSTPKEEKIETSPTTSTGQSAGTPSGKANASTGNTPASNATISPNSTASTVTTSSSSGKASSPTTSDFVATETDGLLSPPPSDSSVSSQSAVPGNASTNLPSNATGSASSPVPASSPPPVNATVSSSSVPTSPSPSIPNINSSTTTGAKNEAASPTRSSAAPGTTAPPGSAGKILWEYAVSYSNCSVLLTSTLAYSNGTKANVTKWVDDGCGNGWETTVGNNMINPDGAIVVSQVGLAYEDCTLDVTQLLKYPNGTEINMTTTYTSDCSITTPGEVDSSSTPSSASSAGKEKILGSSAQAFPNCTVVITKTVQYPNKTIANISTTMQKKCGTSFDTGTKNATLPDGTKIISETGTAYENCTLLIKQELEYLNGTQGTKDSWLGDPCLSTTVRPSSASTGQSTSATTGEATTPKAVKVTAKIIAVKAQSLPNCTAVITQTMQYSNGTVADTVKTYNQKCGGNFTVDYSDQNLTLPDGGRLMSSTASSYGNCSLAVTNKIQYPNNTMANPTTWYNESCDPLTSSSTREPSTGTTTLPGSVHPTGVPATTTDNADRTTQKPLKVTAKIIAVKAQSLPNCTVVITQTMQFSNGTVADSVKTYNRECGGNFTVDYSDQNLTMPDGGRLLSSTGSSYGNCSLAVTNKIQYPNNTMINPITWYNQSCESTGSSTGLPPTASAMTGATSSSAGSSSSTKAPTVSSAVGHSSEAPSSSPGSPSSISTIYDTKSSPTKVPGSSSPPSTVIPQCPVESFKNDSSNTIVVNGTNMVHTCKSGFTFPDGSPMKMSECVNGIWKGLTNATCQPNSCPPLSISLTNARTPQQHDSVMTTRQPIGTMAIHSCTARHVFPSGEPMRIYDCAVGGIWKGKINSDSCQYVEL